MYGNHTPLRVDVLRRLLASPAGANAMNIHREVIGVSVCLSGRGPDGERVMWSYNIGLGQLALFNFPHTVWYPEALRDCVLDQSFSIEAMFSPGPWADPETTQPPGDFEGGPQE